MKQITISLSIWIILCFPSVSQNFFNLSDTALDTGQIYRTEIIYEFSHGTIGPKASQKLDSVVTFLRSNANISIEVQTNTDYRDTEEKNDIISAWRARGVLDYLISNGIDSMRLTYKGLGERNPVIVTKGMNTFYPFLPIGQVLSEDFIKSLLNKSEQEIANRLNRRTDFKIIRTWL